MNCIRKKTLEVHPRRERTCQGRKERVAKINTATGAAPGNFNPRVEEDDSEEHFQVGPE